MGETLGRRSGIGYERGRTVNAVQELVSLYEEIRSMRRDVIELSDKAETNTESVVWLKVAEHNRQIAAMVSDAIGRQLEPSDDPTRKDSAKAGRPRMAATDGYKTRSIE